MGEIEKALNDYNALLALNPDKQDALYARGILFLDRKELLRAAEAFDRLLQVNEKSVKARLGFALLGKIRGNFLASERIFNN